jgi:tRNA(Ile)-lysidine synthase
VRDPVLHLIREHGLLQAGDRVGLAVSGGADSVALLRVLLELRDRLGVSLVVLHFHHGIRAREADDDQAFVQELAIRHSLEFHAGSGDAPACARERSLSLEAAARELRYDFFSRCIARRLVTRVATAHTLDDQAETVLLRLLRGAGTRGLAGIYPFQADRHVVRPLLAVRRAQVEQYLRSLGQPWRDDATNLELHHARNRIRHELLPLLARSYNPEIATNLARMAEIARAEEEYWETETRRLLPLVLLSGKPVRGGGRAVAPHAQVHGLLLQPLLRHPLALQRRLVRAAAAGIGLDLDAAHVEQVLEVAAQRAKSCNLPSGWVLRRSFRELRFEPASPASAGAGFDLPLPVPGAVLLPGGVTVRTTLEVWETASARDTLDADASGLRVRNWRPGDRFRPAHAGSEKKVKELLQGLKLPLPARRQWPVVVSGEQILWVRGTRPRTLRVSLPEGVRRLIIACEG